MAQQPLGVPLALEYLSYAINSILYLRGVYPANSFRAVEHKATGLSLMVSADDGVTGYLGAILSQIATWLAQGTLQAVSLVIFPEAEPPAAGGAPPAAGDVIERWTFQFRPGHRHGHAAASGAAARSAPGQLCDALRHLTASAGMLPARASVSTFEVITYNAADSAPPRSWEVSDPMELEGADELPLRPFDCAGIFVDGFITFYCS